MARFDYSIRDIADQNQWLRATVDQSQGTTYTTHSRDPDPQALPHGLDMMNIMDGTYLFRPPEAVDTVMNNMLSEDLAKIGAYSESSVDPRIVSGVQKTSEYSGVKGITKALSEGLGSDIKTNDTPSTGSHEAGQVGGNGNIERVWNFFAGKGLPDFQIAGILGNMKAESGVIPNRVQGPGMILADTPPEGRVVGYGLVQFTPGTKILPASKRLGMPPGDLVFQCTLLWEQLNGQSEIPETKAGQLFFATTSVDEATTVFEYKYERHAKDSKQNALRIGFARDILADLGSRQVPSKNVGAISSKGDNSG